MHTIYLENRGTQDGAECSKFFQLEDDGHKVIAKWGSIGQNRPPKVLVESEDAAVRQAAWNKKLKEKTQREDNPYQVIWEKDGSSSSSAVKVVEARPSSEGRRWGLEVETHSNLDITEVIEKMEARGLQINDQRSRYFDSTGQKWDVKRDGSCGYEFTSPILSGNAGIFDAKLAVEKIREVCENAVNRNCGIHVTIDVSDHNDADLIRLAVGYLKCQDHFYAECAEWRQDNRYCAKNPIHNMASMLRDKDAKAALERCGGWRNHSDRYHGLNFTRTFSKKVVEFRMMESTVSVRKVGAWIRLCVGFVDGLKKWGGKFTTTEPISAETFKSICEGTWKV